MLDEETQALARQAGLEVMHPPVELRDRLGSKIVMTRLADEAGVPSVPHVIGRAGSYDELLALAQSAGLGDDLVARVRLWQRRQRDVLCARSARLGPARR